MNNLTAGIGDVLLRYPELIEDVPPADTAVLDMMPPNIVAVHLGASDACKIMPQPELLHRLLVEAGVPFVRVGLEGAPPNARPSLRTHIAAVRRAGKFIGTLSCFNVVAQLSKVPSFVLVNSSIKEPFVYGLMAQNGARVEAWNGRPVEKLYAEVVEWTRQ